MTKPEVRTVATVAFAVLCALIGPAGWAQPLVELLRATPESAAAQGREVIEYLDLTAFALDSDDWWQPLAVQPGEGRLDVALEATTGRYGFDLRDAQLLAFGDPPWRALMVRVAYDRERVEAALTARGYEATTAHTIDRYVSGEDCATDFAAGDHGDLFAGSLGKALRLALLPGVLANSCSTDVSDDVLSAHMGDSPSLFDVASHRELAEAALDHGDPAQALFLGRGTGASLSGIDPAAVFAVDPDLSPEEQSAELAALLETEITREPLPLYTAALLADVGPSERLVLALHYLDRASAETAQPVLEARLEGYLPDRVEGMSFAFATDVITFEGHGEGTAVVVAVVHFGGANAVFRNSVAGLWQRDFAPLALP